MAVSWETIGWAWDGLVRRLGEKVLGIGIGRTGAGRAGTAAVVVGLFAGLFFRIGGFGFSVESSYICIIYILVECGLLAWLMVWAFCIVDGVGCWHG
jgi:hypothetical protein